jgi:hypothetical protein
LDLSLCEFRSAAYVKSIISPTAEEDEAADTPTVRISFLSLPFFRFPFEFLPVSPPLLNQGVAADALNLTALLLQRCYFPADVAQSPRLSSSAALPDEIPAKRLSEILSVVAIAGVSFDNYQPDSV